jgi:hypothetical protein
VTVSDAINQRLRAVLPTDVGVFDVAVPGIPPARYVTVTCDAGSRSALGADGVSSELQYTVHIMSVATENSVRSPAPLCRFLVETVQTALTDWRPVVDGLAVGPVEHLHTRAPAPDETLADRHVVFAVDLFRVHAERIST